MRWRVLALALLAAIGCADSSGPSRSHSPSTSNGSSLVAQHIDSLYVQACAIGDQPYGGEPPPYNPYFQRCLLLSVLLAAPASGAEPSPLQVDRMPGKGWRGVVIEFTDTTSDGTPRDSSYELIAYSDADVTTAVVAEWVVGNQSAYVLANDTVAADGYSSSATISTVSRGGRCSETPGLANPLLNSDGFPQIEYSSSICQLSTFSVSWTGFFNVLTVDAAYGQAQIPTQTVNGITVTNSPWGIHFRRALEVWLRQPGRAVAQAAR